MNFLSGAHRLFQPVPWLLLVAVVGLLMYKFVVPWMSSLPLSVLATFCGHPMCMPIDPYPLLEGLQKAAESVR